MKQKNKLAELVDMNHHALAEKLEEYFETNEMSFVLAQWRDTFKSRLHELAKNLQCRAIKLLDDLISSRQAFESLKRSHSRQRDEFLKKAKDVAANLEGHGVSQKKLKNVFKELWIEWMVELQPEYHAGVEVNVEADVEKALVMFFRNYEGEVIRKLQVRSLKQWAGHLKVNDTHTRERFQMKGAHNMLLRRSLSSFPPQAITDRFLDDALQILRHMKTSSLNEIQYNTQYILRDVTNKIDTSCNSVFSFTQEYKIDMCLTVCGYAVKRFEGLLEALEKERSPFEYLEAMKESMFLLFQNMYYQIARESVAADTLCELLVKSIKKKVVDSLGHVIVDDMNPIFHSKRALKARILLDLAKNLQQNPKDFQDYLCYLTDTKHSFEHWIKVYTKQHCQAKLSNGLSKLTTLLFRELTELMNCVKCKIKEVTGKSHSITQWLLCFCQDEELRCQLTLDVGSLLKINVRGLDVGKFSKHVGDILEKKQKELYEHFIDLKFEDVCWKSNPCEILFKQLQGCCERCPFCNEQCDCSNKGHDIKHSVQQHRPLCLGSQCVSTHKVVFDIDICTSKVGSDDVFQNSETKQKPHPYKEYTKVYPE